MSRSRLLLTFAALAAGALAPRLAAAQSACNLDPNSYDCWAEGQFDWTQCAEPTLAECQDPSYLASQCAPWKRSTCNQLVSAAYQSQAASIGATRRALPPGSSGLATVKSVPYDRSTDHLSGYHSTYTGKVLNQRFYRPSANPFGVIFQLATPQQRWESDGEKVTSCEEYAYEKYYTWSQYEQSVKDNAGDWYASWDAMMRDGGPLRDGNVRRRNAGGGYSASLPTLLYRFAPPPGPKNAYFQGQGSFDGRAASLPQPSGSPYVWQFDARIASWLAGGKSWAPPTNWETLRSQGYAVTQNSVPEQYLVEQQKQKEYLALWDQRRQWYSQWLSCAFSPPGSPGAKCPVHITTQAQAAEYYGVLIYLTDANIQTALLDAQTRGCLSTGLSVCEWSPKHTINRLTELLRVNQQADYQRCLKITRNQFGKNSLFGKIAVSGFEDIIGTPTDYRISSSMLDIGMGKIETWLGKFQFPTDPNTGRPVLGDHAGDSTSIGGKVLGASFGYSAGWSASDFAWGRDVWQAQAKAYASAYANATIFTQPVSVFDGAATAWTHGDNQVSIAHHVRVLGYDLYTPVSETRTLDWHVAIDKEVTKDLFKASTHIVVVCVPIRLAGGLAGTLGFRGGLGAKLTRNASSKTIDLQVKATATPHAKLSAFLSASVDAGFVEIGIRGDVNLIGLELPFTGTMALQGGGPQGHVVVKGDMALDVKVKSLDGRVTAFIDYWLDDAEVTVFEWGGLEEKTNLFTTNLVDAPLYLIRNAIEARSPCAPVTVTP